MTERYMEAAFVLLVVGGAMIWPPLALLIGGAFLISLAYIHDRRTPPAGTDEGRE